eukprot:4448984-Amphidinium_carterae.1
MILGLGGVGVHWASKSSSGGPTAIVAGQAHCMELNVLTTTKTTTSTSSSAEGQSMQWAQCQNYHAVPCTVYVNLKSSVNKNMSNIHGVQLRFSLYGSTFESFARSIGSWPSLIPWYDQTLAKHLKSLSEVLSTLEKNSDSDSDPKHHLSPLFISVLPTRQLESAAA